MKIFERLFVQTISACVAAGLVEESKIHMDGELNRSQRLTRFGHPEFARTDRRA